MCSRASNFALIMAISVGITCFYVPLCQAQDQGDSVRQAVRIDLLQGLKGPTGEKAAEDFVRHFGESGKPYLIELMKEDTEPGVKARVAFRLGKLGDPEGLQCMADFLERPLPDVLEGVAYTDVWCTMLGIGFLGSDEAIDYLARLATEDYWNDRLQKTAEHPLVRLGRNPNLLDAERSINRLRADAIMALGAAGNARAERALYELRGKADSPALVAEIDGKLLECQRRMRSNILMTIGIGCFAVAATGCAMYFLRRSLVGTK